MEGRIGDTPQRQEGEEMDGTETTKTCSACKQELPLDAFARKKDGVKGRQPYCRTCATEKRKKYERRRAMKDMGMGEKIGDDIASVATACPEPDENGRPIVLTVTIPTRHRDLYLKLQGMAEKEFRSPENQLLWILKEA